MLMARAVHHGLLRNALICILPAALMVGGVAQLGTTRLALGPAYWVKAAAVFVAGTALVLIGLPKHHPFESFGAANQVTLARGALVALLAGLIGERGVAGVPLLATLVAVAVAALDGVDGWLARRTQMASRFGARFDMETDAVLILVLAVLAQQFGRVGVWVLASGLLRYAFVGAGVAMPCLRHPLPPSERRKAVAVIQVVALIATLAPFIPAAWAAPLAGIGLCALTWSFLLDVVWLFQNAAQSRLTASPQ
ncbi:MAG TPA: CDP-alcohol phosphatidyltransferase family protein [Steroidobacteraceae bacterium]|jgi:phosphatidylglycerophosphate synthase